MTVRIIKLVCPEGHITMAAGYESADGAEMAEARELAVWAFRARRTDAGMRCDLCGSRDLRTIDILTPYTSTDEAWHALAALHAAQARMVAREKVKRN